MPTIAANRIKGRADASWAMHRPVTLQPTLPAISFNHEIVLGAPPSVDALGAGINPGIRFITDGAAPAPLDEIADDRTYSGSVWFLHVPDC